MATKPNVLTLGVFNGAGTQSGSIKLNQIGTPSRRAFMGTKITGGENPQFKFNTTTYEY